LVGNRFSNTVRRLLVDVGDDRSPTFASDARAIRTSDAMPAPRHHNNFALK
jgi:hypothetical protein